MAGVEENAGSKAWDIFNKIKKIRGEQAPGAIIRQDPGADTIIGGIQNLFGKVASAYGALGKEPLVATPVSLKPQPMSLGVQTPATNANPEQAGGLPETMAPPVSGSVVNTPVTAISDRDLVYNNLGKLAKSNPKKFVEFADTHPGIPGVGYVKDDKGRIVTMVEDPAKKPQEPLTIAQSDAAARMITAQGHLAAGVGSREQAVAYKAGIIADKAQGRELEKQKEFENRLDKNSITQTDVNGNVAKNYKPWLLEQSVVNPENVHPAYKEEANSLKAGFDNYAQSTFKMNPTLKNTPVIKLELLKRYQQSLTKQ
jgi:hypothetical protein